MHRLHCLNPHISGHFGQTHIEQINQLMRIEKLIKRKTTLPKDEYD